MEFGEQRELVGQCPDILQYAVDDGVDEEGVLDLDQVVRTLAEKPDPLLPSFIRTLNCVRSR